MFTILELNTFCHVLEHFQIHYNYVPTKIDRKLNIFCRHDFRGFVRYRKSFVSSLVKHNYDKFSPKGEVDVNINFN